MAVKKTTTVDDITGQQLVTTEITFSDKPLSTAERQAARSMFQTSGFEYLIGPAERFWAPHFGPALEAPPLTAEARVIVPEIRALRSAIAKDPELEELIVRALLLGHRITEQYWRGTFGKPLRFGRRQLASNRANAQKGIAARRAGLRESNQELVRFKTGYRSRHPDASVRRIAIAWLKKHETPLSWKEVNKIAKRIGRLKK